MKITYQQLSLPGFAIVSTSVIEVQCLSGHPLALHTAFLWVLAVQAITMMALFDIEQHYPTALMRFAAFALLMGMLTVFLDAGIGGAWATAVLLVWRWTDVVLMLRGLVKVTKTA